MPISKRQPTKFGLILQILYEDRLVINVPYIISHNDLNEVGMTKKVHLRQTEGNSFSPASIGDSLLGK
jgi:hypothetical protein